MRRLALLLPLLLAACAERPVSTTPPQPLYPFHLTVPGAAPGPRLLALGTYNLHNLAQPQALAEDLRALASVNTWAFQEFNISHADLLAWNTPESNPAHASLQNLLQPGEWHGWLLPCNFDGQTWESQVLATRWPALSAQVVELRHTAPKRRAALSATLDAPGMRLRVINTDHETALLLGPRDRFQQVQSLTHHIQSLPAAEPVILMGDLNTSGNGLQCYSSAGEIAALHSRFQSVGLLPAPLDPRTPTFHAFPYSLHLDHIFARGLAFKSAAISPGRGSDHHPVWCIIEPP